MLFLLPPSESQRKGGSQPNLSQVAQSFGVLTEPRNHLVNLIDANRQENEVSLWKADTLPAIERFNGTLYDALAFSDLSESAKNRASQIVLIQTALFGLIGSFDRIPNYKFSSTDRSLGINPKHYWSKFHEPVFNRLKPSAPIIDLRSKAYVELAPINSDIESYWVEVVSRNAQRQMRALNHFNKKSKGLFIRAVLETKALPQSIEQLAEIAATLGFDLELNGENLRLIIPGN